MVWTEKPFVHEHVTSFLHVPLNMDAKMRHAMGLLEAAKAQPAQALILADDSSPWGSEVYVEATGPVPGAEMATISGTFLTQVFDGPFSRMGRWADEMRRHVAASGRRLRKLYFGYTTCPKCAKAYGHNYVVVFAQVDPAA